MSKTGNTNAQKGDSKRVPWYGMIDQATKDAIRRIAAERKMSQSEVVDMWREVYFNPFQPTIEFLLDLTTEQKYLLEKLDIDWLYLADQLDLLSKTLKENK